jgi:hypothetical protein
MEWLFIIAFSAGVAAFVLRPLLVRPAPSYDWDGTGSEARRAERTREIEAEVMRYREALRSGTICTRCSQANPPGSRFCGDCGRALQNAQPEATSVQVPST